MSALPGAAAPTSLLHPRYRRTAIGAVSLVFLAAFEALAVTTIMATVVDDLDGRGWYSVAFSATLAASVVGTVAAGLWADRRGAAPPLTVAVAVFVGGLVLAGLAPSIELFVAARFAQGLGAGALTVSLYVLVAEQVAEIDRPRMFAAFAAAWVLPSMVGPPVAGVVAEAVGWRWVFLGVVVLAAGAAALLAPALRGPRVDHDGSPGGVRRLLLALAVSASVVVVDLAGRLGGTSGRVLAVVGVLAALVAVRPLLPVGTLRAAPGLPAVVLLRGLAAAAFFATEIHVPYLLQTQYGAAPAVAGLALTVGALGWAGASQVQGRLGERMTDRTALRAGALLLLAGLLGQLVVAGLGLSALLVPVAWVAAGAGMGSMYPRVSTFVLRVSAEHERGTHTAAITIADAVGGAVTIALTGLVLTGVAGSEGQTRAAFAAVFALTSAVAALAVVASRRTA